MNIFPLISLIDIVSINLVALDNIWKILWKISISVRSHYDV